MPSRYVIRSFSENSFHHVFNRGVEGRKIFLDEQDYNMFLYYLFIYVESIDKVLEKYPNLPIRLNLKNLSSEIELISYCLMPSHFHFLIKQNSKDGISKLLKQVINGYTEYFNKKYKRIGALTQGRFKAVKIENDETLIHISRYIHLNPCVAGIVDNPKQYAWSSYKYFLAKEANLFCKKDIILKYFQSANSYEEFVLNQINYGKNLENLKHFFIDGDD